MKKRKRSTIRKARQAILKTADEFQKSGIDCSKRFMFVGGTRPKSIQKERDERNKSKKKKGSDNVQN